MSLRGAATLASAALRNRRLPTALALSGLLLILASTAAGAAGDLTPAYVATLGGPGHAAMYPSGMEIVPTNSTTETAGIAGNVVVADTGNDRVAEYTPERNPGLADQPSGVANEGSCRPVRLHARLPPVRAAARRRRRLVGQCLRGRQRQQPDRRAQRPDRQVPGQAIQDVGGGAPIGVTVSTTHRRTARLRRQRDQEPDPGLQHLGHPVSGRSPPGRLHHQSRPRRRGRRVGRHLRRQLREQRHPRVQLHRDLHQVLGNPRQEEDRRRLQRQRRRHLRQSLWRRGRDRSLHRRGQAR